MHIVPVIGKILTDAYHFVNCQYRGQLSDAMVLLNQTDRSLNGF